MKKFRRFLLVFGVPVLSIFGCMAQAPTMGEVATLKNMLQKGQLTEVTIIHVPYSTLTRTRVDSMLLEKMSDNECNVHLSPDLVTGLVATLDKSEIHETDKDSDLRWGIFFHSENMEKAYSLFLDGKYITGTGRHGLINNKRIILNNNSLVSWVENAFMSTCPSSLL